MRKYILSLFTVFALCLLTAVAAAQTPGGTTGVNQQDSSKNEGKKSDSISKDASQSSAPVTGSQTDPYSVNSGPNARAAEAGAGDTSSSGKKTLEGCIVREQTDYFIQPKDGDRERLTGSDVSSHVGHQVKVHGTEQNSSAANSTGNVGVSGTAGTSGSMASNSDRTSTSGSASSESQNNAAGSIAGNSGSSNATGTGASGAASSSGNNWSGKDFMVTKVDMVSESCPADIQKKIDENKSK